MGAIIELNNVTYSYPLANECAIKNVSLKLEEGRFYGVIGQNGSGKTTLCSLIRGFAPSFFRGSLTGEVLVCGKPTLDYKPGELSLKIGYVFQNPFSQISGVKDTVFEEVAFGLENFGVPVDEIEERVIRAVELTGISALAEKNPYELSGGQQQRMALASIIVLEPDIMVIDEPTSQLDPEGTESVFEIIKGMKDRKKTIILVEHKVDLIAEHADEVIVLDKGEVIRFGSKDAILSDETLLECGVQLPNIALLGNKLTRSGVPLERIPITEQQGVEIIGKALRTRSWCK
ncbi:MAG: energy-coupling factor ABC transporter ATP-binding protein [Clostridiales bacterium]|jgi:energy-coupling factor transport system ATP-binding protein|nr:energy-coupling factor ABC transporter ATP-binding protein [Clostridiales bacterium]